VNTQQQPTINLANLAKEIVAGQGYVLLPNLLSTAEATEARNIVLKLADKERQQKKLIVEGVKERLYGLIYKGKIFEKMVQHPQVLSVIEAILAEDIVLGGFSAHILHPGAQRMGVHVDYPYWAMSPPYPQFPVLEVQVIWLVEDFTEDNGAPLFVPGSQKLATKPDLAQFERVAQKITAKAGTAIISHGLCWHDTSVNSTDKPRVSILGNYTPQYIHPLEDNLFDFQPQVIDRATPKLRQLLRHDLKSPNKPVFDLKFKLND
jgi:ectoine hydroxylase-related dioxygenase (phytanoyl-CoA dioxygenase family)